MWLEQKRTHFSITFLLLSGGVWVSGEVLILCQWAESRMKRILQKWEMKSNEMRREVNRRYRGEGIFSRCSDRGAGREGGNHSGILHLLQVADCPGNDVALLIAPLSCGSYSFNGKCSIWQHAWISVRACMCVDKGLFSAIALAETHLTLAPACPAPPLPWWLVHSVGWLAACCRWLIHVCRPH